MNSKYRIAFVTGSRAEYGIVRKYLSMLNYDNDVSLEILVTGALLDEKYGYQVELIKDDGFNIGFEMKVNMDSSNTNSILHSMADIQKGFADWFSENKYDLVIVLGDRYEMISISIAASMLRLPILHIHGGEATFVNYDEFIRHSITKMSLFHFTSTEEYRNRVIQLGENPERVFNLGALGAENCTFIDEQNVIDEVKNMPSKSYFTVLFHPETLSNQNPLIQTENLLNALDRYKDYTFVFLGNNADTKSDVIRKCIDEYILNHENAVYFENLHPDGYHYLAKNSICLIGNSSSGLIEVPSLGTRTINIGDRQKGRVFGNSILNVRCVCDEIDKAIETVLNTKDDMVIYNPYYQENAALKYYRETKEILDNIETYTADIKVFYDLKH